MNGYVEQRLAEIRQEAGYEYCWLMDSCFPYAPLGHGDLMWHPYQEFWVESEVRTWTWTVNLTFDEGEVQWLLEGVGDEFTIEPPCP